MQFEVKDGSSLTLSSAFFKRETSTPVANFDWADGLDYVLATSNSAVRQRRHELEH